MSTVRNDRTVDVKDSPSAYKNKANKYEYLERVSQG